MTYQEFKQDTLEHLLMAYDLKVPKTQNNSITEDEKIFTCYLKNYTNEEVDLMREHCKNLKGDELIKELKFYLDCGNPNNNSPYFKNFMSKYKKQLLEILLQSNP